MHLYSNNLSTITTISSSIISELFPAFFSCSNNLNLSQSSSGSEDKNIVFEIPEAMIAGELSIFIIELCLILGRPVFWYHSSFLLQTHKLIFCLVG